MRYKRIDEITGEKLESSHIVDGYAVGKGEYVVLTHDEIKAAAQTSLTSSRSVALSL